MQEIFELLLNNNVISNDMIRLVEAYCKKWGVTGYHGILETHLLQQDELADVLARILKLDRIFHIKEHDTLPQAICYLEHKRAQMWECFPNKLLDDGKRLEIIIADPTQPQRISYLKKYIPIPFDLAVGTQKVIRMAIDRYYPLEEQLPFLKEEKELL